MPNPAFCTWPFRNRTISHISQSAMGQVLTLASPPQDNISRWPLPNTTAPHSISATVQIITLASPLWCNLLHWTFRNRTISQTGLIAAEQFLKLGSPQRAISHTGLSTMGQVLLWPLHIGVRSHTGHSTMG